MKRRGFLKFLGLAPAALSLPTVFESKLWTTIENKAWYRRQVPELKAVYFDRELIANLKATSSVWDSLADRRPIPNKQGIGRQFFQYETKS